MKRLYFLIVILLSSCLNNNNQRVDNKNNHEKTVNDSTKISKIELTKEDIYVKEEFIKSFYQVYIHEIDGEEDEIKIDSIIKEYCSEELIKIYKSTENLDFDPFINGQDVHPSFMNILKIGRDLKEENIFSISLKEGDNDFDLLKMQLIKKDSVIKINNLYFPDGEEMLKRENKVSPHAGASLTRTGHR